MPAQIEIESGVVSERQKSELPHTVQNAYETAGSSAGRYQRTAL